MRTSCAGAIFSETEAHTPSASNEALPYLPAGTEAGGGAKHRPWLRPLRPGHRRPADTGGPRRVEAGEVALEHPHPRPVDVAGHPGGEHRRPLVHDCLGEVVLELDDGAEIGLKAGDCVIQNGTRHAWHNRSSQRCVVAFSLVGAQRERTT